jgi:hypothetical protein
MKMKWFDTQEIKDADSLAPEDIAYLKEPSITILGPFNVIARKHWDILVTSIGIGLLLGFLIGIVEALYLPESISNITASDPHYVLWKFLTEDLPSGVVTVFLYVYFGIKHGRRLAWNRNDWGSLETFKKSEEKWHVWGMIGATVIGLSFTIEALYAISNI